MSDTTDDGGPAFPHINPNYDGNWDKEPQRGGMSLRAWLAGHVVSGLMAQQATPAVVVQMRRDGLQPAVEMADISIEIADAIIAKLKEVKP